MNRVMAAVMEGTRTTTAVALVSLASGSHAFALPPEDRTAEVATGEFTELGTEDSSVHIRPLRMPYFVGESLVLEITIRNRSSKVVSWPAPDQLILETSWWRAAWGSRRPRGSPNPYGGPPPWWEEPPCMHLGAPGPFIASEDDDGESPKDRHLRKSREDLDRCLRSLKKGSLEYQPGQGRAVVYKSKTFHEPGEFSLELSSHDILPDRRIEVTIHSFKDVIQGHVPEPGPYRRLGYFHFLTSASPGTWMAFRVSYWPPGVHPDVEFVNRRAQEESVRRLGLTTNPNATLRVDDDGTVWLDGRPVAPVLSSLKHWPKSYTGWSEVYDPDEDAVDQHPR